MSRLKKYLLGFLSIYPISYMLVASSFVVYNLRSSTQNDGGDLIEVFGSNLLFVVLPLHLLAIFGALGLIIYYIYRVLVVEPMETNKKIFWCLVLLMVSFLSLPLYWYTHIWKSHTERGENKIRHRPGAG